MKDSLHGDPRDAAEKSATDLSEYDQDPGSADRASSDNTIETNPVHLDFW